MSLLKKLGNAVKGGVVGFATGGYAGAAAGAVAGFAAGNPKKTKNAGIQPQYNVTKGKIQLDPNLSPQVVAPTSAVQAALGMTSTPLSSPVAVGSMSASGLVRNAASAWMGSGFQQAAYSGGGMPVLSPGAGFQGGGSSGAFGPIQSVAPGTSPVSLYHMFYTKRGTPRRIKRNGMPYKPPRMNPMNPRAARRAIRRIRGARKLLQRIERSLPRARATHRSHTRRAA